MTGRVPIKALVRQEQGNVLPDPRTLDCVWQGQRCPFCNAPRKEEVVHGHYFCITCKQITKGCCGDSD